MSIQYSKDHEWINAANPDAAIVGITLHAQDALGDVVFVDLPAVGTSFNQGDVAGVVESVKAAADVYMPVSGEIVEVNEALRDDPPWPTATRWAKAGSSRSSSATQASWPRCLTKPPTRPLPRATDATFRPGRAPGPALALFSF